MKVLLITYFYPPMGGAGVQRGLKFSKYLPLAGIEPVVLAADDPHYVRDSSLLAEVPAGVEVHRVKHTPWLARLASLRRSVVGRSSDGAAAGAVGAATDRLAPRAGPLPGLADAAAVDVPASGGMRAPLRDAALSAIRALQFPDDAAAWARAALIQARRALRDHQARGTPIELVFSSSPPASAHQLAERLADEFDLPWIADFRDLWTDNPAYDAPGWRRRADRRLEQRWLARASGIVTVTPSWQAMLQQRRQEVAPDRLPVAYIPNGYDEDDFVGLAPAAHEPGVYTLVHTGTFYGPRDPAGLLAGLARYLDGPRLGHPELRVRLVGNMGARFDSRLHEFSVRYPGIVLGVPYLPHAQALAEMLAADALLLVVGGGRGPAVRGWLPGKIFEYLRSGKPVLTLGDPEGDAAQLIARHGRGLAVEGDDVAGIAAALHRMLQAGARGAASVDDARRASQAFERRELSRQLADFMRACRARHVSGAEQRGVAAAVR